MFERDGRASARFSVVALPLPEAVLPVHLPPCTSSVDVCCCFNRGSMTLSASLSDTQVRQGVGLENRVGLAFDDHATRV